jgi:hypothetical protein
MMATVSTLGNSMSAAKKCALSQGAWRIGM